jgi:hypothetical protein
MVQREVQDEQNVTWTCVQAFGGISEEGAAAAAEKIESERGTLPVVCTPSGGEQSVRIELPRDWVEKLSDEELLREIGRAKR